MRRLLRVVVLGALCGPAAVNLGCSRQQSAPAVEASSSGGAAVRRSDLRQLPGTRFDVTYSDRTVAVDRDAFRRALKSVSRNRRVFVFDKSAEPFARLAPGSILFIRNLAFRKVVAVATEGDRLYVGVAPASLPDVIRNGDIHWEAPIRFADALRARRGWVLARRERPPRVVNWLAGLEASVDATVLASSGSGGQADAKSEAEQDGGLKFQGILSGWEYTVHYRPVPDRLNYGLTLSRKKEMTEVEVSASGYIQNFETSATVLVEDGVTKYFDYRNKDLNGAATFTWSAEKTREGKEDARESEAKLKLPTSFTIPLMLGEFPFALEISEAVIVAPVFSQVGDAARGSFRVSYNGTQGFSLKGGQPTFDGKTEGDAGIEQYGAVSRMIPGACLVAIAFPKIELKPAFEAGLEKIEEAVPAALGDWALEYLKKNVKEDLKDAFKTEAAASFSAVLSTSALSSGTTSLIPCQGAHLVASLKVGVEAKILGVSMLGMEKELYSRKINEAVPRVKGCLGE